MYQLAALLGTLTGILFTVALLNYPVKWINKKWISKLPKTSQAKTSYQSLMKILVKYHRFFAIGAAVTLTVHFILQITYNWISLSGLTAAALLVTTAVIGSVGFFKLKGKRGNWLLIHRTLTVLTLVAIFVHKFIWT